MIRVRHYTRVSSVEKILASGKILARDQNKVFVERANSRKLSASDAEKKYGLALGKGNAYVEFDIEDDLLQTRHNPRTKIVELFILGDIELENRNVKALFNF